MRRILICTTALCLAILPSVTVVSEALAVQAVFDGQNLAKNIEIFKEELKANEIAREIFDTNKKTRNAGDTICRTCGEILPVCYCNKGEKL